MINNYKLTLHSKISGSPRFGIGTVILAVDCASASSHEYPRQRCSQDQPPCESTCQPDCTTDQPEPTTTQ